MGEQIGLEAILNDRDFMQGFRRYMSGISQMEGTTSSVASKLTSSFTGVGRTVLNIASNMAKAAVGGATAIAVGFGAAAVTGLKFNSSLEIVQAQLMAFLKDGDKVAATLDMIRDRASRTPFQFQEMANAAAALIPAAKQSGTELEKLIGFAEILAASNPAEGLEGAAFSLKEALGGDFVSIVERFNLPRQMLNDLKKEGVPALEAVSMAMQSLGLDASLVTNLSQTAVGRLSTIKDGFLTIASNLTQPIFNVISNELGEFITLMETAQPSIDAVTGAISGFIEKVISGNDIVQSFQSALITAMMGLGFTKTEALNTALEFGNFAERVQEVYGKVSDFAGIIVTFAKDHAPALQGALAGIGAFLASAAITTALISIGGALLGLASPVTLMIGLSAALGAAWSTNWGNIQGITQNVIAGVKSLLDGDGAGAIALFKSAWEEAWGNISTAVGTAWTSTIQPALITLWTNISTWFTSQNWGQLATNAALQIGQFFNVDLQPFLTKLNEAITYITNFGNTIGGFISTYANPLLSSIGGIVGALGAAWSTNWGNIQGITQNVIAGVKSLLDGDGAGAIALFKSAWEEAWGNISTAVGTAWTSTIQPALITLWTNISTWFTSQNWGQLATNAALQIGQFFNVDLQPFLTKLNEAITYITNFGNTIGGFISTYANPLLSSIGGIVGALGGFALVPTVTGWIAGLFASGGILTSIITGLSGGFVSLASIGIAPVSILLQTISSILGINLIPFLKLVAWTVGDILVEKFTSLWGILSSLVSPALTSVSGLFGTLWRFIGPVVSIITAPLMGALTSLTSSLGITGSSFGAIVTLLGGPVSAVLIAIGALVGFVAVAWIRDWGNIREIVTNAWEAIKAAIESAISVIRPAFDTFMAGLKEGFASFAPLGEQFKQLWVSIEPIVTVVVGAIGAALAGLLAIVVGVFNGIASAISPFLQLISGVVSSVIGILTGLADFVTGFVSTIVSLFQGDLQGASDGVRQMADAIWQILTSSWNGIVSIFQNGISTILSLIGGFVEGIVGFFTNLYMKLVGNSIIPDMVRGILQWIGSLASGIVQPINQFIQTILTAVASLATKIIVSLVLMYNSVRSWFATRPWAAMVYELVVKKIVEPFTKVWVEAKLILTTFFSEAKAFLTGQPWGSIGTNIVEGIKNGLAGAIGGLVSKAAEMALAAFNAAKSALGITSPSKMFMTLGGYVGQGLEIGIQRAIPGVVGASGSLASAVGDGFSVISSSSSGAFSQIEALMEAIRVGAESFAGLTDQAKSYIELIGSAVNVFKNAIETITALQGFKNTSSVENIVLWINHQLMVMAFALQGGVNAFGNNITTNTKPYIELITSAIDVFKNAIETITALQGVKNTSSIEGIALWINHQLFVMATAIRTGAVAFGGLLEETKAYIGLIREISTAIKDGVDAISSLSSFVPLENASQVVSVFVEQLLMVITSFSNGISNVSQKIREQITVASELSPFVSDVLGLIKTAVEALSAINSFVAVENLQSQLDSFVSQTILTITNFAAGLSGINESVLEQIASATNITNSIKELLSLVKTAVDALAEISKFVPVENLGDVLQTFVAQIVLAITILSSGLNSVNETIRQHMSDASSIAGNVKEVLGIVKTAVDALSAISKFIPVENLRKQLEDFSSQTISAVVIISIWFTKINERLFEYIKNAADLTSNIKEVLGLVKTAVDALAAISKFVAVENLKQQLAAFVGQTVALLGSFASGLAGINSRVVGQIEVAVELSPLVKELLGIVKTAVDALAAISKFVAVENLKQQLAAFVTQTVALLGSFASGLAGINSRVIEQIVAAAELSPLIKELLDAVKTAVDALAAISKFVAVENLKQQLAAFVTQTVALLGSFASGLAGINSRVVGQIEVAVELSPLVKELLGIVKTAVDALAAIAKFVPVENLKSQLDLFSNQFIETISTLSTSLNDGLAGLEKSLSSAGNLSELSKGVLESVKRGVDSLKSIGEYVAVEDLQNRLNSFISQLIIIVVSLSTGLNAGLAGLEDSLSSAGNLSELSKDVLATISTGVKSLTDIGAFALSGDIAQNVNQFVQGLILLVTEMANGFSDLSQQTMDTLRGAGEWSGAVTELTKLVSPGVDAIVKLVGFVNVAGLSASVYAFTQDLITVVTILGEGLYNAGLASNVAVLAAGELSKNIDDILKLVEPALKDKGALTLLFGFSSLDGIGESAQAFVDDLITVSQILVNGLTQSSLAVGVALPVAAGMADNIKALFEAVNKALLKLDELAAYEQASGIVDSVDKFFSTLKNASVIMVNHMIGIMDIVGETAVVAASNAANSLVAFMFQVKLMARALDEISGFDLSGSIAAATQLSSDLPEVILILVNGINNLSSLGMESLQAALSLSDITKQIINAILVSISSINGLANTTTTVSLQSVIDKIINAITIKIPLMDIAGQDFGLAFSTGVRQGIGTLSATELIAILLNILIEVLTAVESSVPLYQGSWNIGQRIVQGIADGIDANRNLVQSSILGITDSLIKLAEINLGIASPSKVFTGMGLNIGAGMGVGIANSMKSVNDLMTRSIRTMTSPPPSRIYGSMSNPSISKPVVVKVNGGSSNTSLTMNTQTADASSVVRGYNLTKTMSG